MHREPLAPCPGCRAPLPPLDGPTHRYIGASPACWALYTALGAGEPPLAPAPMNGLLVDAYAAQHPGTPSPQSIQSVAVHLLALHGVFAHDVGVERALWLRLEALQERSGSRRGRYSWLEPPDFTGSPTVAAIARASGVGSRTIAATVGEPTPEARATLVARYVEGVYRAWANAHGATITAWYKEFVGNSSGRR